jgi:hypothetical protein
MAPDLPLTPVRPAMAAAGPGACEDQLLAVLLTTIWAIRTGRTLPPVPVSELSPEELVNFWADDQLEQPPEPKERVAPWRQVARESARGD